MCALNVTDFVYRYVCFKCNWLCI